MHQLLAGDGDHPRGLTEVHVPREMLSDLYDHPVVITPDYVGRDRRAPVSLDWPARTPGYLGADRRASSAREVEVRRDRGLHGVGLRSLEAFVVLVATLAVAVPLTLVAQGTKAPAIANLSPTTPKTPTHAGSPGVRTIALQGPGDRMARHAANVAARERLARQRSARRAAVAAANREARAQHVRHERAIRRAATVRRQELVRRQRAERAAKHRSARRAYRT